MIANGYEDAINVIITLDHNDILKIRNGDIIYSTSFIDGHKRLTVECYCSEPDNEPIDN